ncbi:hypothetical protein [Dinoroseobacter sp. S375]|uniref:hypothetical protein n=1 Tax=Dinoroseobacter sp. S375 TaxID=3415136 RepID=UPI003C7C4554
MEICDRETAEAWSGQQDPKTIAAFAARNSLRAMSAIQHVSASSDDLARFFILRSTLIACVSAGEHSQLTANKLARAAQNASEALRSELRTTSSMDNSSASSAGRIALNAVQVAIGENDMIEKGAATAITWAENYVANSYAAANRDAQLLTQIAANSQPASDVFMATLWPSPGESNHAAAEPAGHVKAYESALASMDKETAVWSFWQRWWEGMRTGAPLPWELQERISLIPNELWDVGPRAVSKHIAKIDEAFSGNVEPLNQEVLRSHVKSLLHQPELAADAAESMAAQLERQIADYKREGPANDLPEGFEGLERLPLVFRNISTALRVSGGVEDDTNRLVAEINRLHSVIAELEQDLAKAQHALADARLSTLEAAQQRTLAEKTQTWLMNITLLGSLGLNLAWFMGLEREDLRYPALEAQFEQRIEQMKAARPSEENGDLATTREL